MPRGAWCVGLPGRPGTLTPRALAFVLVLVAGVWLAGGARASALRIETPHLIVSDATGRLPDARLEQLAAQAQGLFERVLALWSVDSGVGPSGKIRVIFDAPRRRDYYASVVDVSYREGGRRVRAVRVFGAEREPQELAHKLAHAVFLQEDKLIRNMIGVATEERLGNALSFPGCGFSADNWVRVLQANKALIPLDALGPDHESWGMKIGADGFPMVVDRARQSTAYAQAGSFGGYLIRTYGVDKVKELYRRSAATKRPWQEVFGVDIRQLEGDWLQALQTEASRSAEDRAVIARLWAASPDTACIMAQRHARRPPQGQAR